MKKELPHKSFTTKIYDEISTQIKSMYYLVKTVIEESRAGEIIESVFKDNLGEDIKVVSPLPSTNIHVKSGEIFGDITAKRVNKDANWMFIIKKNNQS